MFSIVFWRSEITLTGVGSVVLPIWDTVFHSANISLFLLRLRLCEFHCWLLRAVLQIPTDIPSLIEAIGGTQREFYQSLLRKGKAPMLRSKLMLVGPGRAGKTSLLRRLTGQAFREEGALPTLH